MQTHVFGVASLDEEGRDSNFEVSGL
jgi:hypothetical protein